MTNTHAKPCPVRGARLALACAALLATLPAMAQRTIAGPYLDLATTIPGVGQPDVSTKTLIQVEGHLEAWMTMDSSGNQTSFFGLVPNGPPPFSPCGTTPWNGPFPNLGALCINWTVNDSVSASPLRMGANPVDMAVKGLSFFSYDVANLSAGVQVTTLYGQDVPNGSRLQMAAFDPVGPAIAFSNERIFGSSGRVYTSTVSAAVSLGDLGVVLGPGYDISGISGDPHGNVYLFQTNVPVFEISSAVPEPASYAMLACGLAALGLGTKRRRSVIDADGADAAAS